MSSDLPPLIAIDGPAAAGKNTVGKLLAKRLGYAFVDTGLMYRAVAYTALREGIDPQDEGNLGRIAEELQFEISPSGELLIEGGEAGGELLGEEIGAFASRISRSRKVREILIAKQREIGVRGRIVMAGRDIGTVVFPDAAFKIFLTASAEERARRRHKELRERGREISFEEVLRDIEERDRMDRERSLSPLRPAPDAHIIDTEGLTPEEVVRKILELLGEGRCRSSTTSPTP